LSEREERAPSTSARTLAIVVARCHRAPARLRGPARIATAGAAQAYGGRFALESDRDMSCAGTAEVLHRQLSLLECLAPLRVLVIESDALRGIDYAALIDSHVAAGVGATLAFAEESTAGAGGRRAIVTLDGRGRVLRLWDVGKPLRAPNDGSARHVCAGAYVLDRELLVDCLEVDAVEPTSAHDFRADVLPVLLRANGIAAHRAFAEWPSAGERTRQVSRDAS
jgi:glucose-1-phosphate adenylyltransferase